jgi:hypothetical protein
MDDIVLRNASVDMSLRYNAFTAVMQASELRDLDDPSHARDRAGGTDIVCRGPNGSSIRVSKRYTKSVFS